ncbi:amidase [Calocera cornea HHB12733]|uniref:Amidase n=1 Tax=Calocera cornea HHB12733 TaxID=1353952 RepID=A0A165GWY1_9BASI|nr:amidase [Calocera cornea HHB12733]
MVALKALLFVLSLAASAVTAIPTYGVSPKNGKPLPDLLYANFDDLSAGMADGTFSAVDLVKAYLMRIDEINPVLHAVIETNPDAIEIAAGLDAERANGTVRGPLHGIPIIVKDNVGTLDKMNTTAGSYALLGTKLPRDSNVARKLKEAGAIILGKANLSQWANYRSTNGTSGWTSRGGQCYNAYYPFADPSGSSSGSGVVSSIGLAAGAVGSETSGSIVGPSWRNSLAGIKPTVGLTSRDLVVPISQTQDTVGPMCKTLKDSATMLHYMAGPSPYDNYTSAIPFGDNIPDYAAACVPGGLKGAKIGVPWNAIVNMTTASNLAEVKAFNASLDVLTSLGATVIAAPFPDYAAYRASSNSSLILMLDFKADIANYYASLAYNPTGIHTLGDLINFTHTDPREDWPDRNTVTWDNAWALPYDNTSPEYWAALQADYYLGQNATILGSIETYGLDAMVIPTSMSYAIAAIAGYPIVTVPNGYYPSTQPVVWNSRGTLVSSGPKFPFGLAFYAKKFEEEKMIKYACDYEQATQRRSQLNPYIIPNFQLIDVM